MGNEESTPAEDETTGLPQWMQAMLINSENKFEPWIGSCLFIANAPFLWLSCWIQAEYYLPEGFTKIQKEEIYTYCNEQWEDAFSTLWDVDPEDSSLKKDEADKKSQLPDYTFNEDTQFENISEIDYLKRVEEMKNDNKIKD